MRNRIAAFLMGLAMIFGLGVAVAPSASADTYTTIRHVCASNLDSIRLETKWGANYYYRNLPDCTTGPSGANGGHVPKRYHVPAGWCVRNNIYNNGVLVATLIDGAGWHSLVANRRNNVKAYRC